MNLKKIALLSLIGLVAAQTDGCVTLTRKSVCGPEFEGLPVLSPSVPFSNQAGFDNTIKELTNETKMADHYDEQFKCNRNHILKSLNATRYLITFWCSFYSTFATNNGCKPTNDLKTVRICKAECDLHVLSIKNLTSKCSNSSAVQTHLDTIQLWCMDDSANTKCTKGIELEGKFCGWSSKDYCAKMQPPDDCCKKMLNSERENSSQSGITPFPWWVILLIVLGGIAILCGFLYLVKGKNRSKSVEEKQNTFEDKTEESDYPEIKSPNSTLPRNQSKNALTAPSLAEDLEKSSQLPVTTLNTFFGIEDTDTANMDQGQTLGSLDDPTSASSSGIDTTLGMAKAVQDEKPNDIGQVVVVTDTYQATGPDELNLVIGDLILVKAQYDDGWGVGIEQRGKKEGVFPLICTAQIVNPPSQVKDPQDP